MFHVIETKVEKSRSKSKTPKEKPAKEEAKVEIPKSKKEVEAPLSHNPPRPLNVYTCFTHGPRDHVDKGGWTGLFKQHKEAGKEVSFKIAGDEWKSMTADAKKKYEDMGAKEKEIFEARVASIKKKGYYMMADGSKSTDEKNAKLFQKKEKKEKKDVDDEDEEPSHPPPKRPLSSWLYFLGDYG